MADPIVNEQAARRIPVAKPWITDAEKDAVRRVLDSGWISGGPEVERFEAAIAGAHGGRHGVACNSGTTALHLALRAVGVHEGSLVLLPTMTMVAVANAVLYCGARPIFADSDFLCGNPSAADVDRYAPLCHAAVIPHLYGAPAHEAVKAARRSSGSLWIIQDCAEAHYARIPEPDKLTLLAFSFYANKIITSGGEGGMVATQCDEIAGRLRRLRAHAFTPGDHFNHDELAYGYRMTDVQAAFGTAQHERHAEIIARREALAKWYACVLSDVSSVVPFVAPENLRMRGGVPWVFPVLARDEATMHTARRMLAENGVDTRRFFKPLHRQKHLARYVESGQRFDVADDLYSRGFYLPLFPELTDDDVAYVAAVLRAV